MPVPQSPTTQCYCAAWLIKCDCRHCDCTVCTLQQHRVKGNGQSLGTLHGGTAESAGAAEQSKEIAKIDYINTVHTMHFTYHV